VRAADPAEASRIRMVSADDVSYSEPVTPDPEYSRTRY
jgi:hypothetical protein